MIKTRTHTFGIVGADEPLRARICALLDEQPQRLDGRWRLVERTAADLLLVDTESVYGHMDWLRERANGRLVAACASQPDPYRGEFHLPKPVLAADLAALLNQVGALLSATAPEEEAPPPDAVAQPESVSPPSPSPASLLDLLEGPTAVEGRCRLAAEGRPELLLDPTARHWYCDGGLRPLAGWYAQPLPADAVRPLPAHEFGATVANLAPQPYSRLIWLAHLLRGGGRLDPRLDPAARYKLAAWPPSEREFPKHFRIATAMLRQAATLEEIAGHSSATPADVADFVNAYHAIGYVEISPAPAAEAPQRGLFARRRKSSAS